MIQITPNRKEVGVCRGDPDDEPPPGSSPALNAGPSDRSFFGIPVLRNVHLAAPGARNIRPVEPSNPRTLEFRLRFYAGVTDAEWNDWRWQMRNRIRTAAALGQMVALSEDEAAAFATPGAGPPIGITPYYMSLVDPANAQDPIRRTVIPTRHEQVGCSCESPDPLHEDRQSPVPGLIHRYPDRVLILATDVCSTYCRYCTRSRRVGHGSTQPSYARLETAIEYIRRTPEVRDVLISGGDPLLLADPHLDRLLRSLRAVPHVEILRIGTKTPAVLPQRITPALVRILKRAHPLWISLHFTHPAECVAETERACARLADAGIPLGSQTVLLKGINDQVDTMRALFHHLMRMRVRPYYLYQCDPIPGSAHFRTSVSSGLNILKALRGHTSGYAIPTYVIDAPGGGGKIPLMHETVVGRDGPDLLIRNYEGRIFRYTDGPDECRIPAPHARNRGADRDSPPSSWSTPSVPRANASSISGCPWTGFWPTNRQDEGC